MPLLRKAFSKGKYELIKCIYDLDAQLGIINELLQNSLDRIPDKEIDGTEIGKIIGPRIQYNS